MQPDAENVVVEVLGVFHVNPFLHAVWPRFRHRHSSTHSGVPRDDYSHGRGAVTRQENKRPIVRPRRTMMLHLSQGGSALVRSSCHVPHDLVLFLFSAAAAVTDSTPFSLWVGRPPHAMPCNASIARAVAYRQGTGRGAIWHLSHCLRQCRDYGMREKHMGISARLNFLLGVNGCVGWECVHVCSSINIYTAG